MEAFVLLCFTLSGLAKFAFRDYREIPQLDTYDLGDLDEETYSPIDINVRRNAEEVMRRRDKEQSRQQGRARIPSAFLDIDMGILHQQLHSESLTTV